jgi:hypothetical protein
MRSDTRQFMRHLFAYFLAVVIGPILVIFIATLLPATENKPTSMRIFLETFIGGFASVCLAKFIFNIVGVSYNTTLVLWIGLFFIVNNMIGYFMDNTSHEIANVKFLSGMGVLCGVIVAGILIK